MTSMKGKRVILTGPTSGVGKEIALQLAVLGAELILGCRDIKKMAKDRRGDYPPHRLVETGGDAD